MSDQLSNSIDKLKGEIYKSNFDISKYFLPDNEIVKNIISSKGSFSKDDLNLMVDGTGSTGLFKKVYPLSKDSFYYDEAKKTKDEVKQSVALLMKEKNSISGELINMTISISNSIPAMIGLATTLPVPNVNAAVSLACGIISQLSKLYDKIQDTIVHLDPLKNLKLLVDSKKYSQIIAPITAAISALVALFLPISKLMSLIGSLKNSIKNSTSPEKLNSQLEKLKEEEKKKKSQIEASKLINAPQKVIDALNADLEDIRNAIADLEKMINGEIPTNLSEAQEEINRQLLQININNDGLSKIAYIYDVELPDGTLLYNQTDDDLKKLSEQYKIVYQNG